jgi:hypothetical protein
VLSPASRASEAKLLNRKYTKSAFVLLCVTKGARRERQEEENRFENSSSQSGIGFHTARRS